MLVPSSKLPNVGTTIFTVMSKLAAEHGAINLSQGFPDFDCDPALVEAVARHMREGRNQYAPMAGVQELREALAGKIERLYDARYDPQTEITITSGGTEALFCAIVALATTGDEVIVFEPAYDAYVPAVRLAGAQPVFVTLRYPDYAIDWDAVRKVVTRRTRLILLNSPHNPTGTIVTRDDLVQLAAIVDGTSIIVIGDEVYEHMVFDGRRHESLASHPDLRARSCVVSSFGKTFHTTGWKIGYVSAPEPLTTEIRKVHQFVTFASNTPVQHAYADFTWARDNYDDLAAFYQGKRDRFLALIASSRFRPLPCRGTYFQLVDYSAISRERDAAFAMTLLTEHGVAAIPTSPFLYVSDSPTVLRFCFAKKAETLERAAERLQRC